MPSGLCCRLINVCFTAYERSRTKVSVWYNALHAEDGFMWNAFWCQAHNWKTQTRNGLLQCNSPDNRKLKNKIFRLWSWLRRPTEKERSRYRLHQNVTKAWHGSKKILHVTIWQPNLFKRVNENKFALSVFLPKCLQNIFCLPSISTLQQALQYCSFYFPNFRYFKNKDAEDSKKAKD